jgi:hypothetical protein
LFLSQNIRFEKNAYTVILFFSRQNRQLREGSALDRASLRAFFENAIDMADLRNPMVHVGKNVLIGKAAGRHFWKKS